MPSDSTEKRAAPRYKARLDFRVLIIFTPIAAGEEEMLTLVGYTRDLSATGLALVVSSKSINEGQLLSGEMNIVLSLPTGSVELTAITAHYGQLNERETGLGYLIGAHITKMSDGDRARYFEYINTLS